MALLRTTEVVAGFSYARKQNSPGGNRRTQQAIRGSLLAHFWLKIPVKVREKE